MDGCWNMGMPASESAPKVCWGKQNLVEHAIQRDTNQIQYKLLENLFKTSDTSYICEAVYLQKIFNIIFFK